MPPIVITNLRSGALDAVVRLDGDRNKPLEYKEGKGVYLRSGFTKAEVRAKMGNQDAKEKIRTRRAAAADKFKELINIRHGRNVVQKIVQDEPNLAIGPAGITISQIAGYDLAGDRYHRYFQDDIHAKTKVDINGYFDEQLQSLGVKFGESREDDKKSARSFCAEVCMEQLNAGADKAAIEHTILKVALLEGVIDSIARTREEKPLTEAEVQNFRYDVASSRIWKDLDQVDPREFVKVADDLMTRGDAPTTPHELLDKTVRIIETAVDRMGAAKADNAKPAAKDG
jgi:hypothetical protein